MRCTFRGVILLLSMGCVEPATWVEQDLYLALGASWTVDPSTLCDTGTCGLGEYGAIKEVSSAESGTLEVTDIGPNAITLEALDVGDTQIKITGEDREGNALVSHARVRVREVAQFDFVPQCDVLDPLSDPWILPPSGDLFVEWALWDEDEIPLLGHPSFELDQVSANELDPVNQDGIFALPDIPGSYEIHTSLLEESVAVLEVHAVGDFDGFEAGWWPEALLEIGEVVQMRSAVLVDGRRVCLDSETRQAEVLTPDTCSFSGESSVVEVEQEGPDIRIFGFDEGVCTVEVWLSESGVAETLSVDVIISSVDPEGR